MFGILEIVANFIRVACISYVGFIEILNSRLRYSFSWVSCTRQKQEDFFVQHPLATAHSFYVGICCYYDLSQTSCVNQEVKVFNRKLCKYLKAYKNTLIVEVDSNRDYYTRHGLHLNRKGKELTAKKIALAIQNKLNTQNCDPIIMRHNLSTNAISLPDQANTTTTNHEGKFHKHISSAPIQHTSPTASVSLRHKKPPRSLTDDFLW